MSKRLACLAAVLVFGTSAVLAQPERAARGAASTSVGGKKVAVDYGRPALGKRSLDELLKQLPADRMWRAGEQQVTTISLEGDATIGGKKVPAGMYSLYVHAGENMKWELVVNRDLGIALGKIYDKASEAMKNEPWPHIDDYTAAIGSQEVARIPMTAAKPATPADLFTISFAPAGKGATMTLAWADQSWSTEIVPAK
jgi:Protein of unknown function (DUF2911)